MRTKVNLSDRAKNGRNGVQLVYVVEAVKNSTRVLDEGKTFENDKEVLNYFFKAFDTEFNYQVKKRLFPSLSDRVGQWLRGLPSCASIEYTDFNIKLLGVKWGVLSSVDDKKSEKFVFDYWRVLGVRFIQAAIKVGLNPYKYAV